MTAKKPAAKKPTAADRKVARDREKNLARKRMEAKKAKAAPKAKATKAEHKAVPKEVVDKVIETFNAEVVAVKPRVAVAAVKEAEAKLEKPIKPAAKPHPRGERLPKPEGAQDVFDLLDAIEKQTKDATTDLDVAYQARYKAKRVYDYFAEIINSAKK